MNWFLLVWDDLQLKAGLITLVIALLTAGFTKVFAGRPKLIWGIQSDNHLLLPMNDAPVLSVFVRNITVSNTGRKVAEQVEVVFNYKPQHLEHFPHLPMTDSYNADNRYILTFTLNPREFVNFSMLSTGAELPPVTYVRCFGYSAKHVPITPMHLLPKWHQRLNIALFMAGIVSVLYAAVYLLVRAFS